MCACISALVICDPRWSSPSYLPPTSNFLTDNPWYEWWTPCLSKHVVESHCTANGYIVWMCYMGDLDFILKIFSFLHKLNRSLNHTLNILSLKLGSSKTLLYYFFNFDVHCDTTTRDWVTFRCIHTFTYVEERGPTLPSQVTTRVLS